MLNKDINNTFQQNFLKKAKKTRLFYQRKLSTVVGLEQYLLPFYNNSEVGGLTGSIARYDHSVATD